MANSFLNWDKYDDEVVQEYHGHIYFYRDLYEGKHADLFQRAKRLVEEGEIVDNLIEGSANARNVRTPYLVANVSKLIVDIPAMFVSRAIGTAFFDNDESFPIENEFGETEDKTKSQIVNEIERASNLKREHWTNIIQHQIDGGIVGVVEKDENGIRILTKSRDMYYPHEDGLGCDVVHRKKIEVEIGADEYEYQEFIHVHREYVEEGDLITEELLFEMDESGSMTQVEESEAKQLLGKQNLVNRYVGRNRPFVVYWANDKTFMNPLGSSALKGQEGKQEEINWTLTRNAIVYQRNGKPRIAVSKEIFSALQDKAFERYGDESKIDHRDLEIVTMDDSGKSMEVIQIDVSKIGDIQWVKDLMKLMFIETRTSEKAVDFYLDGSSTAQSGIAKFYDLFTSIMKAEKLAGEYVDFLQELYENCLWLLREDEPFTELIVERPNIPLKDMIPTTRKEIIETESQAFESGVQSLYQTLKQLHPNASEDMILEEQERIEGDKSSQDSMSLGMSTGTRTLTNLLDNRNANGEPIGTGSTAQDTDGEE